MVTMVGDAARNVPDTVRTLRLVTESLGTARSVNQDTGGWIVLGVSLQSNPHVIKE